MEKEEKDGTTIPISHPLAPTKKRTSGSFSLFRAAALMLRRRTTKKIPILESGALNLVSVMRPLHLQQLTAPPSPLLLPPPPPPPTGIEFFDVPHPPPPESPVCSDDSMSRYASAEDLQALDTTNGDEGSKGGNGAPNPIDMQAEEFIARFYQQIKLQRRDSFNQNEGMIQQVAC